MKQDLSDNDAVILRTLWEMKALGTRAVPLHELVSHLPGVAMMETSERLQRLQALSLITRTEKGLDHLVALSPLGTALVRQLQDRQLRDLTRSS